MCARTISCRFFPSPHAGEGQGEGAFSPPVILDACNRGSSVVIGP